MSFTVSLMGRRKPQLFRTGLVSFISGTITYTDNAKAGSEIAELVRMVPNDKLLLETDAPYLAPQPVRRAVNTR